MKEYRLKSLNRFLPAILILMFITGLTGCTTTKFNAISKMPEPASSCKLPRTMNLSQAIDMTKQTLGRNECVYEFTLYFENLLEIGKGDPSLKNKEKFSSFLIWSNETGILSKLQAKEYYNRYFNTLFMSLPEEYNTCSISSQKEMVIKEMELELIQKQLGLLSVCEDKTSYYEAHAQMDTMILLIEATCMACENNG